ncbi:MAG: EAL domain-containing protein [Hylemonella sp.]|nr:EAL domain-containing protein [Hylemonella sp.]
MSAPLLLWIAAPASLLTLAGSTLQSLYLITAVTGIVLDILVFVTAYSAMLSRRKGAVVWLGVSYLGVGLLDTLHLVRLVASSPALSADNAPDALLYWLAARLLAALALLVYATLPVVPDVSRLRKRLAIAIMAAVVTTVAVLGSGKMPLILEQCHTTPFMTTLAAAALGLQLLTLLTLRLRREDLAGECQLALATSAALGFASLLFFVAQGRSATAGELLLSHGYAVAATLFLLHVTHNEALARPLQLLERQRQREQVTLNAAPDAILWIDTQGGILSANPGTERLTGYAPAELVGQNVSIFLPEPMRERHAGSIRQFFTQPHSRPMGSMDLKLMRRDGSFLPVDIALGHHIDDGEPHVIAYVRDLTDRKKLEDTLRHQATHDELTGLPNRWLFRLQLDQAIARATRRQERLAVVLLDLDHFKNINDSFGHAAGDALLVQVSQRIRGCLRHNDTLARLGGDEFAILLTDLTSREDAVFVANKLLASLQGVFDLQERSVYSSGSMGLAFYADDAQDCETLLRYADLAMYRAKQFGRGRYACYAQDMDLRLQEDMLVHARLKEALRTHALQLHYQPIVCVADGQMVGAEALLRWQDPELGHVSPARFIPVAEANGLIHPLSDWVLEQACLQIVQWCRNGTPLRVAVNFSAPQFRQPDLADRVRATLEKTGAQASLLEIEITESVAMEQPELAAQQIRALVALGCRVAMDDFGTGYSSLAHLKSLPVSKLKIDKQFLDGLPHDSNDATLTKAIIGLAQSLGMTLVAEGVETDAQLAFLRQHGCEDYQGWLFSKAMDAQAMSALLAKRAASPLLPVDG